MTTSFETGVLATIQFAFASIENVIAKAEAHLVETGASEAELLQAKLADDMFPLVRQIQTVCDNAKGMTARLAGVEMPAFPDEETSFAELKTRIKATREFIDGIDKSLMAGSDERPVVMKTPRGDFPFESGFQYYQSFAQPNLFFHLVTAYDILRANGVPLGKFNYLGRA